MLSTWYGNLLPTVVVVVPSTVQITASYLLEDSNNCPCSSTNCEHGRRKERIEPVVIKRVETDIEISEIVGFHEIKLVFLSLKDMKLEHADPLQI